MFAAAWNVRTKMICGAGLVLLLLAGAAPAGAQDREGRWEFTLGTFYQLGVGVDSEGGGSLDTDDEFGFAIGGGYNFSDRLALDFAMQWARVGYDATAFDEDGGEIGISGSYDAWTTSANLIYHFTDDQLTPYVGAGVGWTWIDTNVPSGPPITWCWWDPWWGFICSTRYPTKTTDAFSYQATAGLRYTFDSDMTFLRLGYTSQWMDFDNASSTPRFDVIVLDFGWIF
jgi:opacity protein-like surface antigen